MKFAIEGGQRQFFKKHQFLEVEGVLTATQLKELNLEIEKVFLLLLYSSNQIVSRQIVHSC